MNLLLFLGLNENSFCQWVRAFYLAKPSHWLVFIRSLRNGSSSLGSSPFYLFMGAQPFWCCDFKSAQHFQNRLFLCFSRSIFFLFYFSRFFAIILTFVFLNFAKILSFSSLWDLTLSTPQTKSRFFGKKNGCFLSTNEHPWNVVLFLHYQGMPYLHGR